MVRPTFLTRTVFLLWKLGSMPSATWGLGTTIRRPCRFLFRFPSSSPRTRSDTGHLTNVDRTFHLSIPPRNHWMTQLPYEGLHRSIVHDGRRRPYNGRVLRLQPDHKMQSTHTQPPTDDMTTDEVHADEEIEQGERVDEEDSSQYWFNLQEIQDNEVEGEEVRDQSEVFDYTSFKAKSRSSTIVEKEEEDMFFLENDYNVSKLPKGRPDGFYIIQHYTVPPEGFHENFTAICPDITRDEMERLKLESTNVTLPVALMLLDPTQYPTFSRARKTCRKGSIMIHRGSLGWNEESSDYSTFYEERCFRGRVGDRVSCGDVIGKQIRMGGGFYPSIEHAKPPFDLPVIYEDDHFAIVNKPAGVLVYAHRKGGHSRSSVRSALPFVLKPPRRGTMSIMRRPATVHRLDKPTSGLLIVAKTKPAMVDLSTQFVERRVKKTYFAIVNGIPDEPIDKKMSSSDAYKQGFDISANDSQTWQCIDQPLDEKSAITLWRPVQYTRSLFSKDGTLTLVELKPKTGRFHQLRRHMAWVCETPIIGDTQYGINSKFRERGLFLCANKVCLDHPYFNTYIGRKEWDEITDLDEKYAGGAIKLSETNVVQVIVSLELPRKFHTFLAIEDERSNRHTQSPISI